MNKVFGVESHCGILDLLATSAFEAIERLYIGWPTRPDTWRDNGAPARRAIVQFIEAILHNTLRVHVVVVAPDESTSKAAEEQIRAAVRNKRISSLVIASDDCWMQDIGPVFARNTRTGELNGVCFRFNAWGGSGGGCYSSYKHDVVFGHALCKIRDLTVHDIPLTLEGGALSSDGCGTLLATRESVLHENRGNGSDAEQIADVLHRAVGARRVAWLPRGAAYDSDTDGHVDNIAVFIAPGEVLLLWADEMDNTAQHARSASALAALRAHDPLLRIHLVDAPPTLFRSVQEAKGVVAASDARSRPFGEPLCASYVNIVILEDCVFAPRFDVPVADRRAYAQLTAAFKSSCRRVVMVDAKELVLAGGGLHCITLAEPKRYPN